MGFLCLWEQMFIATYSTNILCKKVIVFTITIKIEIITLLMFMFFFLCNSRFSICFIPAVFILIIQIHISSIQFLNEIYNFFHHINRSWSFSVEIGLFTLNMILTTVGLIWFAQKNHDHHNQSIIITKNNQFIFLSGRGGILFRGK